MAQIEEEQSPLSEKEEEVAIEGDQLVDEEMTSMSLTDLITKLFMLDQQTKTLDEAIQEAVDDEEYEQADQLQQELDSIRNQMVRLEERKELLKSESLKV